VLVLQALDQLKTMYPKGWATLINTCDTLLFLGGDEKETTEYLSKRAGKQTISVRKNSHNKGRNGGGSESRDTIGRDLLTPDEIGRINGNEALLYISGQFVFKDEKYVVSDHEYADLLANNPGDKRWYRYKRYKNDVEKLLDQVKKENVVNHGVVSDDIAM
jgi:type IV secretion system protein VirD4